MFRNVRFYRVIGPWPESEAALAAALERNRFKPCGPLTERSSGWEAPAGTADGILARRVNGADLLQLRSQSRLLPNAAIAEALAERIAAFEARMEQTPSRREIRRLKADTRDELLPKSLLRSERIRGCFLPSEGVLCIDAGSDSKAERFLDQLRPCLDNFEFAKLAFRAEPRELLTKLFLGDAVNGLELGNECRMQDPSDSAAVLTCRNVELDDPAVRQHVVDGLQLTQLGLCFDATLEFVLSADCTLGKVRFLADDADAETATDPLAELDARFVLLSGTLSRLLRQLAALLGGYADTRPESRASAA